MKNNIYVDIHAIQTVPPSNINRDDTGSPKTAQYGGVTRARVSSQSWKKSIREYFKKYDTNKNIVGIRTLSVVDYISKEIIKLNEEISDETATKMAIDVLKNIGISIKDKENKLEALFFISNVQAKNLAKAAIDGEKDKKKLKELLSDEPSVDLALFGRMVAKDASLNEDASAQVAHAISTHSIQTEFDFYTAVDDLQKEDNAGAGMLGTIEFNSSTLYRYANIAVHEFKKQMNDENDITIDALKLFIEAFIKTMPSGKINTFANQTLPQAVVVSIRHDRPINLVSAFETPVKSNDGYVSSSIDRLKKEYNNILKFVDKADFTLTINVSEIGEEQDNLGMLVDKFAQCISTLL